MDDLNVHNQSWLYHSSNVTPEEIATKTFAINRSMSQLVDFLTGIKRSINQFVNLDI